jgi:hypothetical protein
MTTLPAQARKRSGLRMTLLALGCVLSVAACGGGSGSDDPDPARTTTLRFDGTTIEDPNVFVGLSLPPADPAGDQALAFVVDGDGEVISVGTWFVGSAQPFGFDLVANGDRIEGSYSEESAQGSITLSSGRVLTFRIGPSTGPAGVYSGSTTIDGVEYVARWLLDADANARGAITAGAALFAPGPQPTDLEGIRNGGTLEITFSVDVPDDTSALVAAVARTASGTAIVSYMKSWDKLPTN